MTSCSQTSSPPSTIPTSPIPAGTPTAPINTTNRPATAPPDPDPTQAAAVGAPRKGIDIDAVHDAIAVTGLAGWIGSRFSVKVGKPAGKFTAVECPLHRPGHTGSAGVYTDGPRHRFHCFAGCGSHDAFSLVQQLEGLDFAAASRTIAADFGVTATTDLAARPKPAPPLDLRPRIDTAQILPDAPHSAAQHAAELLAGLDAPQTAPDPHPAWTAAVRTYLAATATGDSPTADAAAQMLAALADPSTAGRLHTAGHEPDRRGDPARTQIVARRWAHHRDAITQLTELRRRHRSPDVDARSDDQAWTAAVDAWLHDPAAAPIAAGWHQPPQAATDTPTAIEQLAALYDHAADTRPSVPPLPTPPPTQPPRRSHIAPPRLEPRPGTTPAGYAALDQAASWFADQLVADNPDAAAARRYLTGRGITPDMYATWGIGWAPQSGRDLCDHIGDIDLAYDIGVTGRDTDTGRSWDHLQGRITFELRDPTGRVIAFAGRTLGPETPRNSKYKNSRNNAYYAKSETLYGADQAAETIATAGDAVIVEGYTDVIAAHAAGITNTVAACGTAIGTAHLDTLQRLGAAELTALLDADRAGRDATNRLTRRATAARLPTKTAHLPLGTDPADLTADQLRAVLADFEPALLNGITAATANHSPADARNTADRLAQLLDQTDLDDPVIAAIVRNQLVAALGPTWQRTIPRRTPRPDSPAAETPIRAPVSVA